MRCPVDKNDMMVVEHRQIELDYCLRCAGVWFDSGELDLLVSRLFSEGLQMSHHDLLSPQPAVVKEARRKCPVCGKKMDKVWLGKELRVLIDSCPIGDGLWFDGGELHDVLQQMQPSGSPNVISFLGEAFQATHQKNKK
jgi:uncharacterized protein